MTGATSRTWWSDFGPLADERPDDFVLHWYDSQRCWAAWRERARMLGGPSRLRRPVQVARASAEAYRGTAGEVGDLPLFNRQDYDRDPMRYLAHGSSSRPVQTSGTTGLPITVWFDDAAWFEANHVTFERVVQRIPTLRPRLGLGRLAVVLLTEKDHPRSSVGLPLFDGALFRRLSIGRGREEAEAVVRLLRANPPVILHGKPTYLRQLIALDESMAGWSIRPGVILVGGENLFDDDRCRFEEWFAAPVLNGYTSAEGGLIALSCLAGPALHVLRSRHLEVRQETGEVSPVGTGELVLSNLSNWATMFLRYRTGDRGRLSVGRCQCGFVGQSIEVLSGREVVEYWLEDRSVPVTLLEAAVRSWTTSQFQLVRLADGFLLRWEPIPSEARTKSADLVSALAPLLAPLPVNVEAVTRITAPGSKAARFVCAI